MKLFLFIIVLISFSMSACVTGQASSDSREEVFLADERRQETDGDEIVITEQDLSKSDQQLKSAGNFSQADNYSGEDGLEIKVENDRYGNKTETRCFQNHPRVRCVIVTTAANGTKETMIFPVADGAKPLTESIAAQALTASADELANAAQLPLPTDKKINGSISPYGSGKKSSDQTLQPLPSSQFPVFPKMVQQNPIEPEEEPTVEEKKSEESETPSKSENQENIDEE